MFFITQTAQMRSKLKRKCKLQSNKSFHKNHCFIPRPQHKRILTQILQLEDYNKQIEPQQIKPSQLQTYGALTQQQIKDLFNKFITKDILRHLIIDTLKLCYLHTPIMQALQTQIESTRDQYKVKDVLRIIIGGHFYQYLIMKTQPTKFLFNNRTTEINIKTILSAILIIVANKLTIKALSDVVLFYRLQEALYETAPHGLPFEFEKIIKAIKKVDCNITAQKFAKWQKRMLAVEKDVKFLEPYHFIYLMSLSEPMSKKKHNLFEAQRMQSKLQKQSQLLSLMKEKNNFISAETHKTNWKSQIKVRGLSFQPKSQTEHIKSMQSEFIGLRKRIISHKRVKSALITSEAVEMVKGDLSKNKQKQNQKLLTKEYFTPKEPQKQRTLLKKHNKLWVAMREFQQCKKQQTKKFTNIYKRQLQKHTKEKQQDEDETGDNQEKDQSSGSSKWIVKDYEEVVDIYSHHLTRILANAKNKAFTSGRNLTVVEQKRQNMLKWL